ncbi:hypothetical protein [Egicoccus sp. AB-alg6-2]|uniref:hypothetical protein n=1 Tax=Egicoccus sp. AB-alg6-2 TaxID=3242692 RepID=UPI00359DB6B1
MKLERMRPTAWRVTFHPLELAALISAARWAEAGAEGELPPDARKQLRAVLDRYDEAVNRS